MRARKRAGLVLLVLGGLNICATAQECRHWASTVVVFAEGSAVLERDQIALIANRLDHFRRLYPNLDSVDLEGVARDTAPDARQLAQRRAAVTAHAVRTLFDGVKLHVSSNVHPPDWTDHDGNYAAFDAVPPMQDLTVCPRVSSSE
ncbi:hypothetical protein ABL840_36510 [Variovorax sp. NFACC27]|jgi:hypothetical protein|uniref:hypothetical protein n=1 Tax=unclassified Variovorax TaxID=663243 RepID=UPI0008948E66|nr:hypothetical protein SAMN03159371_06841 [Variovorax sp. NFACC28]SEG96803.1 hypothetical protein SAMN03159365_06666 [Variovorax sp. NFACC29]SFD86039.1 hypothetical protein SAMN03159379_06519 [Variovorax sp. NFACC26]SFH03564.1 hypothetical protein SAMN03159447_06243 [Variovorax sp. NFACC27]